MTGFEFTKLDRSNRKVLIPRRAWFIQVRSDHPSWSEFDFCSAIAISRSKLVAPVGMLQLRPGKFVRGPRNDVPALLLRRSFEQVACRLCID